MKTKTQTIDPRTLRRQLGLSQSDFWDQLGVTQSGGSRYESGRAMPKPVRKLLGAIYLGETVNPYHREAA
jgi:transcriptional regulator with XRE-family HTH domain